MKLKIKKLMAKKKKDRKYEEKKIPLSLWQTQGLRDSEESNPFLEFN